MIYIDRIHEFIVKHFLLFTNKFGPLDRYHIGYMTGDLYPKIFFFFSNFFQNYC